MTDVTTTLDPNERAIEEVRCSVSGMPISSIPAWYANVMVNFVSDSCRQKSSTTPSAIPSLDLDAPAVVSAVDPELDADPALDDIDVEEIDIDEADIEDVVEE